MERKLGRCSVPFEKRLPTRVWSLEKVMLTAESLRTSHNAMGGKSHWMSDLSVEEVRWNNTIRSGPTIADSFEHSARNI